MPLMPKDAMTSLTMMQFCRSAPWISLSVPTALRIACCAAVLARSTRAIQPRRVRRSPFFAASTTSRRWKPSLTRWTSSSSSWSASPRCQTCVPDAAMPSKTSWSRTDVSSLRATAARSRRCSDRSSRELFRGLAPPPRESPRTSDSDRCADLRSCMTSRAGSMTHLAVARPWRCSSASWRIFSTVMKVSWLNPWVKTVAFAVPVTSSSALVYSQALWHMLSWVVWPLDRLRKKPSRAKSLSRTPAVLCLCDGVGVRLACPGAKNHARPSTPRRVHVLGVVDRVLELGRLPVVGRHGFGHLVGATLI